MNRGHHETAILEIAFPRAPPHEHHRLGRVQALLDHVQDRAGHLPLLEPGEQVPRQVRKVLHELGQEAQVLVELAPALLEGIHLLLEGLDLASHV